MERTVLGVHLGNGFTATVHEIYQNLTKKFEDGWVLDPLFNSKPIRLDNAVIYHLIKYSPEEKAELETSEAKVESVKSVGYEEVDELIKQGYQPRDFYAKNVIMIKMKEEKTE